MYNVRGCYVVVVREISLGDGCSCSACAYPYTAAAVGGSVEDTRANTLYTVHDQVHLGNIKYHLSAHVGRVQPPADSYHSNHTHTLVTYYRSLFAPPTHLSCSKSPHIDAQV